MEEPNYNLTKDGDVKDDAELDPREYIPGEAYAKDPTLYNSTGLQSLKSDSTKTELAEEWVAMRVDYSIVKPNERKSTAVTLAQLTGDAPDEGDTAEALFSDDNNNSYYGLIKAPVFDEGNWIKITRTMCSDEVQDKFDKLVSSNTSEIYVYKYKLKARYDDNDTADDTEDDINYDSNYYKSLDADKFKTYQSNTNASEKDVLTEKTSPLFEKIEIKSQAQLQTNGYQIADLPTFNIGLRGGAIKDMVTITTDEIIDPTTTDATVTEEQKTGSKKVIDSLVELLAEQQ